MRNVMKFCVCFKPTSAACFCYVYSTLVHTMMSERWRCASPNCSQHRGGRLAWGLWWFSWFLGDLLLTFCLRRLRSLPREAGKNLQGTPHPSVHECNVQRCSTPLYTVVQQTCASRTSLLVPLGTVVLPPPECCLGLRVHTYSSKELVSTESVEMTLRRIRYAKCEELHLRSYTRCWVRKVKSKKKIIIFVKLFELENSTLARPRELTLSSGHCHLYAYIVLLMPIY